MITHYRTTENGVETVERTVEGCWIDVVDPTADEASQIARELNVPRDFISDALDPGQVSLIKKEHDVLLVLVRIARRNEPDAALPYDTLPLGIVVTGDAVATIGRSRHELLRDLPHDYEGDLETAQPIRFVLRLLWSVANKYLARLAEIEKAVEKLEDRLERSLQNREVLGLLRYQKSLVHFTTALEGNQLILERLQQSDLVKLSREDGALLEDVLIESRQAIEQVEITGNILSNMMDAFASIISNNLNVVMKFLTSLTVVLIIPTVIGTFYGMNVGLPFEHHSWTFAIMVGISVLCSLAVGLVFWKKGWL